MPDLPKYIFARGQRLWMRLKDENGVWRNSRTPYTLDQVDLAAKAVAAKVRAINAYKNVHVTKGTLRAYVEKWLDDREARGVSSVAAERTHLFKHVLPILGNNIGIDEVRPKIIAAMIYKLRENPALAPRTVLHIVRTLHNLYAHAMIDEIVVVNPVVAKKGVLPAKVDADRNWRMDATYTVDEVVELLSADIIPPERRVLYALKALTGIRHGEAAALQWHHLDYTTAPLAQLKVVQAYSSEHGVIKQTKQGTQHGIPVHPVLMALLETWRDKHWLHVYGRKPTATDLIVPTRNMTCYHVGDTQHAFVRDLAAISLRIKAGSRRSRGGHDLRSWFQTRLIEDGADSSIIRRFTHAEPKDVNGGYERFSWATKCREMLKLKFELDGEPLKFVTDPLQSSKVSKRWPKIVTPLGLENNSVVGLRDNARGILVEKARLKHMSDHERSPRRVTRLVTAAKIIEKAIRSGDLPRALEIVSQLRDLKNPPEK